MVLAKQVPAASGKRVDGEKWDRWTETVKMQAAEPKERAKGQSLHRAEESAQHYKQRHIKLLINR